MLKSPVIRKWCGVEAASEMKESKSFRKSDKGTIGRELVEVVLAFLGAR